MVWINCGLDSLWLGSLNSQDRSGIPRSESELARALPVRAPFFVNDPFGAVSPSPAGAVRATWLGHATVLAEVEERALSNPQF